MTRTSGDTSKIRGVVFNHFQKIFKNFLPSVSFFSEISQKVRGRKVVRFSLIFLEINISYNKIQGLYMKNADYLKLQRWFPVEICAMIYKFVGRHEREMMRCATLPNRIPVICTRFSMHCAREGYFNLLKWIRKKYNAPWDERILLNTRE